MRNFRRHGLVMVVLAALMVAGSCSSSAESVSIAPSSEPASTPLPTPSETPLPAATAAQLPTAPPVAPTAVPSHEPVPPTVAEQPTEVATETERATPTSAPAELVERGLVQDQFCVVDIVAPDTLHVRSGPSLQDAIVGTLAEGECRIYLAEGEDTGWWEIDVERPNGAIRGWVSSKFLAPLRAPIDPDASTVVITISVDYGIDSVSPEPLEAFRLVNAEGLVVGLLNANGEIAVPVDMDLSLARIEAPFADDRYCAWTGQLAFEGADNRYSSLLGALCA